MKEEYSHEYRRWYDKDPILSKSMSTLEKSGDAVMLYAGGAKDSCTIRFPEVLRS